MKLLAHKLFTRLLAHATVLAVTVVTISIGLCAVFIPLPVQAQELKPLTVAMSLTPLSSPIIIAKHQGYFAKNGLDVSLKDVIGGNRAIKALFAGEVDVATSSEVVVMFNSFKRSDFAIVNTFVTSNNDIKILTRVDTGIRKLDHFMGRRIGTVTGASAQFFLDETLAMAGVDPSMVEVVHVNPEDSPSALANGDVDAIVVWEPLAYLTKKALAENAVELSHDHVYTETFNSIVLREYANKNPEIMDKFVRSLIQATAFINTHPEESQLIVSRRINKDINFIRAIWKDFDFGISLHQWLLSTLEEQARWALELKLVASSKSPNYLEFLYLDTLERIHPEALTVFH